ncbi:fructosamine kinase family protein [Thalassospira australica]|uniref:fructosamine kinase family protein n=1 Tax=Thalassospira australica TaxID=1528106 RepID=UPI000A7AB6DC|nr:fructosamine kinase family protein [Thalassospira australica]
MHSSQINALINRVTGVDVQAISPLAGGCVANVVQAILEDGRKLVIKQGNNNATGLVIEAEMLRYFKAHSPIACPDVLYADDTCLIMSFIANDNRMDQGVQRDLAAKLAAQHHVTSEAFGLGFDTLIGGLHQPNTSETNWITFFGEHRLRHMARAATHEGRLPASIAKRIDGLIDRLDQYLPTTPAASLLHGDLWGGNILCQNGMLAGLIDPAIYYGDREIELAFGTLFGDLSQDFFRPV